MHRPIVTRLASLLPRTLLSRTAALHHRSSLLRWLYRLFTQRLRTTEVTIVVGPGAGLRFNPGGANPGYALGSNEPAVQSALVSHLRPGAVFYDIGANVGFHSVIGARAVGPAGRVFAFEPVPANAAALRHNLAINGFTHVEVIEAAVSARSGHAPMLLGEEPTWARLEGTVGDGAAPGPMSAGPGAAPTGAAESTGSDRCGRIEVPLVVIDELVGAGRIAPPDVVKIDAEGAELDVLRGMATTLRTARPAIVCEVHGTAAQIGPLLQELGYEARALESDLPIEQLGWTAHVLALPRT